MLKARVTTTNTADQVLFMNIGWSDAYDGKQRPVGNFQYIDSKEARRDGISEEDLFVPRRGVYRGPLGRGRVDHVGRLDVVYTAINKQEAEHPRRVVAVFRDVEPKYQGDTHWAWATSRTVTLLRAADRPRLDCWPGRMGMRRWAKRGFGTTHDELLRAYEAIMSSSSDRSTAGPSRTTSGPLHDHCMLLSLGEETIERGHFATAQTWRAAEKAWLAAAAAGRPMAVIFSNASYSSSTIYYWARVSALDVSKTRSRISWTDVCPISGHTVGELVKVSDGRPVRMGGAKYFLATETPDFLQRAAKAPRSGVTTPPRSAARPPLPATVDDAERDPLAYEQVQRRLRRHQSAFRTNLLGAYGNRCAITGADVPAVLEAAHIDPHSKTGDNRTDNGLLLRADLHALFDMGWLRISPVSLRIDLHASLRQTTYANLQGQGLRPRIDGGRPNDNALRARWSAPVDSRTAEEGRRGDVAL